MLVNIPEFEHETWMRYTLMGSVDWLLLTKFIYTKAKNVPNRLRMDHYPQLVKYLNDWFFTDPMANKFIHMTTGELKIRGGFHAWMADYVDPIVEWTEEGVAPDRITAVSAPGPQRFSRPLCVYPKLARYKGRGDKDKASSYRCSVD